MNSSILLLNITMMTNIPDISRTNMTIQYSTYQYYTYIYNIEIVKNMLDWQGLLKFSLKYSDGTKKSQFKQMSTEDRKFLQQALQQYCNADLKRLQQILQTLKQKQAANDQDKIAILQQLQELLDQLDKGGLLYKLGGHITLLKIIFYSKFNSNKILALQILSSANQNDAAVQNQSINTGALELTQLIQKQTDDKVREAMMGTISAILRGENLQAKRIFIRLNGLALLKQLLIQQPSQKLSAKINVLFRDLLYYDNYLNLTFKDLSSFSNTAGLKISKDNHDLEFDVNAEKAKNNQLPQNKKYKGMIKIFMDENKEVKDQYQKWLSQEEIHEK